MNTKEKWLAIDQFKLAVSIVLAIILILLYATTQTPPPPPGTPTPTISTTSPVNIVGETAVTTVPPPIPNTPDACANAVPSKFNIGETVQVNDDWELNIRNMPDAVSPVTWLPSTEQADKNNTLLKIIDGPKCIPVTSEIYNWWWKVQVIFEDGKSVDNGKEGWSMETYYTSGEDFLIVVSPTPTPTNTPTATNISDACAIALSNSVLKDGNMVKVTDFKGSRFRSLMFRSTPEIRSDNLLPTPAHKQNDLLVITGGPVCTNDKNGIIIWWEVQPVLNGTPGPIKGWSAESDRYGHYLVTLQPDK